MRDCHRYVGLVVLYPRQKLNPTRRVAQSRLESTSGSQPFPYPITEGLPVIRPELLILPLALKAGKHRGIYTGCAPGASRFARRAKPTANPKVECTSRSRAA